MARVLLINPPWYIFLGMSSSSIPVGLVSLAGSLKSRAHDVAVFNPDLFGSLYASDFDILHKSGLYNQQFDDVSDPVWQLVRERLQAFQPDIVGVHAKTPSWASACAVGQIAKQVLPEVMTVCGGPHVSCLPDDVVASGAFDYGIRGEGEHVMLQLIEAKSDQERSSIPGVISDADNVSGRSSLATIKDLDQLPFDGRDSLMDIERYEKLGLGAIMTARGCPFRCEYCASHKIWGREVRYRSPENVLAEIDHLANRHGLSYFEFCDDTFTINKRRAHQICDMLMSRHRGLQWRCATRCDCLDPGLVIAMKQAGCSDVSIGVESGSSRILKLINKGERKDEIAEGCRILRNAGIPFVAYIMIGFPTETEEEAWETLRFAKTLGADSLCGSVVTPYPGTKMYEWAVEAGKLPDIQDWRAFYHQNEGMGLWEVKPGRGKKIIHQWFERIEAYNERPSRLVRRFLARVRSDPSGAVHRATSVLRHKLFKH